jgi:serine/threonine protein kinase
MSKAKAMSSRSHMKAVWAEKRVLSTNTSPFLLRLKYCFQTKDDLYVTMPFMAGGDLFAHFELLDSKVSSVPASWIAFFAAEIALGLEALHASWTVYRDLKPENVLVDKDGHLALSDFGLAAELTKENNYLTSGVSGTAKYMAPEVVEGKHYGLVPDFYSFGMVLIWMFQGHSDVDRFRAGQGGGSYTSLSAHARDLILRLVENDPSIRLGANGWDEVMAHPFWTENKIDWARIRIKAAPAPVKPDPRPWHANIAPNPLVGRVTTAETLEDASHSEEGSRDSNKAPAERDIFADFDDSEWLRHSSLTVSPMITPRATPTPSQGRDSRNNSQTDEPDADFKIPPPKSNKKYQGIRAFKTQAKIGCA